jgi:hypothetical protein
VNQKVSDLAVTSSDLVFGAAVNGVRHGSMTVTVRNLGPVPLPYHLVLDVPAGLQLVAPSGCKVETYPQPVVGVTCDQTALAGGATKTVTFEFTATNPVTLELLPMAGAQIPDGYGDSKPQNNQAQFAVTF